MQAKISGFAAENVGFCRVGPTVLAVFIGQVGPAPQRGHHRRPSHRANFGAVGGFWEYRLSGCKRQWQGAPYAGLPCLLGTSDS